MKLIFLNVWNATLRDPILHFLELHSQSTDVFCFQEADEEMRRLAAGPLSDFEPVVACKNVSETDAFLLATYVRNGTNIVRSATILENDRSAGLGLYVQVAFGAGSAHVCNLHGVSRPGDKLDNAVRLRQSKELCEFFDGKNGSRIIGGDFNLLPETRSIEIFEEAGYRDLINEFRIPTTRNRFAWERYPHDRQFFCDYAFISAEVNLRGFAVPNVEVSDHLPLILEIEP